MGAKIKGFELEILVEDHCVVLKQPSNDGSGDDEYVRIGRGQLSEVIEELTRLKNDPEPWHIPTGEDTPPPR